MRFCKILILFIFLLLCMGLVEPANAMPAWTGSNQLAGKTATPNPDGSIVHTVDYGDSLYSIAVEYGVTIATIKELNQLTTNDIVAGQKLIIRLGASPTPTKPVTATPNPTWTPRPTSSVTATRRPTYTPAPTVTPKPTATPKTPLTLLGLSSGKIDPLLIGIGILALGGVLLMVVGTVLKRRSMMPYQKK